MKYIFNITLFCTITTIVLSGLLFIILSGNNNNNSKPKINSEDPYRPLTLKDNND